MTTTQFNISGLLVIEPKVFCDSRGYFFESWNKKSYSDFGLNVDFVQDNLSFSTKGTLRGLHFQTPRANGKLVSVLQGEVFDVAVDIRPDSGTLGCWHYELLSGDNKKQMFIPTGFAHGFQVLSDTALFHYKCTEFYYPSDEKQIRWDDPELEIPWPIKNPVLSDKDKNAKSIEAYMYDSGHWKEWTSRL